jgi:hypothetical protein
VVDLLPLVLTDVGDPDVAADRVEREAVGVAQAGGEDLSLALALLERVRLRRFVAAALARVDAQQLA